MKITVLGKAEYPSPIQRTVDDRARMPVNIVRLPGAAAQERLLFELAGARAKLFFNPA